MLSILENNEKNHHIIIFYLLLSNDFTDSNLSIFESLKKKYEVVINYYFIPDIFKSLRKWRGSIAIYYKLFIPLLFPDIKRMIHLDGDTIVFKDLWEMYNLPFNNNYILAQRTVKHKFKDKILKNYSINTGVILFNIQKIREDNKDFEIFYFLFKNNLTEQGALNYAASPKIGYLPFKYGIWFMGNITNFKNWMKYPINETINITEVQEALIDPSILHVLYCNRKHWYIQNDNIECIKYNKLFYNYAKKTDYYQKIYNKYMKKY
jgi:lipopolysaccharide biosynthesis glycosyltransferase